MVRFLQTRQVQTLLLLAVGVVIGWWAHVWIEPRQAAAFTETPGAVERRAPLPPGITPADITPTAPEATAIDDGNGRGRVSSSLDADFDFPHDWDAKQCAREALKELNEFRRMQLFQRAIQRLTPETAATMQEVFSEGTKQQVFAQIIDRSLRGGTEHAAALITRHATEPWLDASAVQRVARALQKEPDQFEAWRQTLPPDFAIPLP